MIVGPSGDVEAPGSLRRAVGSSGPVTPFAVERRLAVERVLGEGGAWPVRRPEPELA